VTRPGLEGSLEKFGKTERRKEEKSFGENRSGENQGLEEFI